MVAQLDQMQGTTPAPTHLSRSASTYAIGPIAPARVVAWKAMLTTGHEITLQVPKQLPLSVLTEQAFKAGMEDGYFACDLDHMTATQTVSDIYQYLYFAVDEEDSAEWCAESIGSSNGSEKAVVLLDGSQPRTSIALALSSAPSLKD